MKGPRLPAWPVACLMTLVIAGCTTSMAPRYYRLAALAEPVAVAPDTARAVIVGPFQLAEYLARPQIVGRDGANGLVISEYERWAEPLDTNFQAVVAANVGRLIGSVQVLEYPAQSILKPERRVTGRILQLDVDSGGLAVLAVQWGVMDGAGLPSLPGRVSRYEARASGPSTAARVAAINATVTAFSADVASAL